MSGKHKCYVPTCSVQIRGTLLMCAEHWALVPKSVRREVYRAWNAFNARVSNRMPTNYDGELEYARMAYLTAITAAREAVECAQTGTLPRGSDVV